MCAKPVSKPRKHKCLTKRCRNKTYGRKFCGSCRSKAMRTRNPLKYAYTNLKSNAKRRGVEFLLTLEEFTAFCVETEYMKGKGRTAESYSIDRIDNTKGYTIDNIQPLTLSENASKGQRKVKKILTYDYQTKYAHVITTSGNSVSQSDANPF